MKNINIKLALYSLRVINKEAHRLGKVKQDAYDASDYELCRESKLSQQRLYTLKALSIAHLMQQGILYQDNRCITDDGCLLESYSARECSCKFHSISFDQELAEGEAPEKFIGDRRNTQPQPYQPCATYLLSLLPATMRELYDYLSEHNFTFHSNGHYQVQSPLCAILDAHNITVDLWYKNLYRLFCGNYQCDIFLGSQKLTSIAILEHGVSKCDYGNVYGHLYYYQRDDMHKRASSIEPVSIGAEEPNTRIIYASIYNDALFSASDDGFPYASYKFVLFANDTQLSKYSDIPDYKEQLYYVARDIMKENGIITGPQNILTQHGKNLLIDATLKRWGVRAKNQKNALK